MGKGDAGDSVGVGAGARRRRGPFVFVAAAYIDHNIAFASLKVDSYRNDGLLDCRHEIAICLLERSLCLVSRQHELANLAGEGSVKPSALCHLTSHLPLLLFAPPLLTKNSTSSFLTFFAS